MPRNILITFLYDLVGSKVQFYGQNPYKTPEIQIKKDQNLMKLYQTVDFDHFCANKFCVIFRKFEILDHSRRILIFLIFSIILAHFIGEYPNRE